MLTIKSDDVVGRANAYDSIIKGRPIHNPNIPSSFNVLMSEIKSLGFSVNPLNGRGEKIFIGEDTSAAKKMEEESGRQQNRFMERPAKPKIKPKKEKDKK